MSVLSAWKQTVAEQESRTRVVAHRGFSHAAPENTLSAVRAAVDAGSDEVEIDVQRTADGQLVVLHDRTLRRTTDIERVWPSRADDPVETFTLAELSELDAGARWGRRAVHEPVPTLVEVLDVLALTDVRLLLELKKPAHFPGIERDLALVLDHHPVGRRRDVEVQSFDTAALRRFHRLAPQVSHGVLTKVAPQRPQLLSWAKGVNPWHGSVTAGYVRRARLVGLTTYAWTVNGVEDMQRLVEAGVDAIITDRPDLARGLIG
ncbi:glycerophosphodiester phosphodiesterase [Solicola sp. PLA-1-18]|jgi:glycerophosphoryl diester phosphodiesterase|uniref:glycerophosphodiester phosphodiesterase n=1 Tax=Solicola sp. PLA-1-18 TaxID=3380532 RepID=UPI003B807908